jgi:hypothetical protein
VANPFLEKAMTARNAKNERWMKKGLTRLRRTDLMTRAMSVMAGAALLLLTTGNETKARPAGTSVRNATSSLYEQDLAAASKNTERQMTTQSKFFCNIKALTPQERAHHKELTEKLMRMRKGIVEMRNGYDLQYSPAQVSLEELVDWVKAEAKCCPFFDFHIDLENEGKLLCLRLTGEEGIKAFIRSEFQIEGK